MTTTSRTDLASLHTKKLASQCQANTARHGAAEQACNTTKLIAVKAEAGSCQNCKHRRKRGLYFLCSIKGMKQVKLYNLCHLWERKGEGK